MHWTRLTDLTLDGKQNKYSHRKETNLPISNNQNKNPTWGRHSEVGYGDILFCFFLFIATPLTVPYLIQTAFHCDYDLIASITTRCVIDNFSVSLSSMWTAFWMLIIWFFMQYTLYMMPDCLHKIFPSYKGGVQEGSISPGGYIYKYEINGLQAWINSIIWFGTMCYFKKTFPTIIYDNWQALLTWATIVCYVLPVILYIKAYHRPNHKRDRKFTTSKFYDFFMGIELNPRFSNNEFDLKLFMNGRPGIIGWSLINLSFMATQYELHGVITNSMVLVNVLHTLYIGYFFYREAWYLKTLDISHDHFGWMFSFGDLVWLPATYTLQALYLVHNPIQLPTDMALKVLCIGLFGFYIFCASNNEKDRFKIEGENMRINGKRVSYIPCSYTTADGKEHKSKLLTSGLWGLCRHINYTGDLILSLAYSLACGYDHLFPYFYFFYLLILLIHRTIRDEAKCSGKYGKQWDAYCKKVPCRFIPGII